MNSNCSEIADNVTQTLRKHGYWFVVEVSPSADDPELLRVHIYGVEKEQRRDVKSIIQELSDEMFGSNGPLLLPMPKTPEVTKEYYPAAFEVLCETVNAAAEIPEEILFQDEDGLTSQHVWAPQEPMVVLSSHADGAAEEYALAA